MSAPTPDDLLERTQWDAFWLPDDARFVDRPELAYSASGADRAVLNCVVRTRLAPSQISAALDEIAAAHAGVTSRWMVVDGTRPTGLGATLSAVGYAPGPLHRTTFLPVDRWRDVETGHTVRRVADPATLSDLYDVASAAFGDPRRPDPASAAAELAACADPDGRVHRYVVYDLTGAPVASGGLNRYPALRFGFLWAGGTAPTARGRGAYRALLQARIQHARRLGIEAVGLYARHDTSWPIVERLGFETHGRMVYWDRSAVD